MDTFWTYFEVLAPSIGVGLVFWLAIRSIFRADRKERATEAEVREELSSRHNGENSGVSGRSSEHESTEKKSAP